MGLRNRTLQMVVILMLAIGSAAGLIGLKLIYPRFVSLEQDQARHNAEMVVELLNRELTLLSPQSQDWSYWDESYRFALERNADFIESNLDLDTQISLKANFLGFYDASGHRIWSRAITIGSGQPLDLPELDRGQFPIGYPLLAQGDAVRVRSGLLATQHGPMLAVSAPILKSNRTGPYRGTLIFGRMFDLESVRKIAREGKLDVQFSTPGEWPDAISSAGTDSLLIRHSPFVFNPGQAGLVGKTVLFGIDGHPALVMVVSTPGDISAQGRSALKLAAIFLAVTGVLASGLLIAMLNREIILPVQHLTDMAQNISDEGNPAARVRMDRDDEIGDLGREFNDMLDRLGDARRRLLDQSYKAGASEMAGGMIHDLRESLGPIREKLDSPLHLLDRAQTSGQQVLLRQLGDPNIARPKQAEVLQMLQENISEQASLLAEARAELRVLRRHLEQTQDTLNEYARYLDSKTTLAPVSLSALLDHAARSLNPTLRAAFSLDIDDSVARVGNAVAAREVLQQVIHLIIRQSAQALQQLSERQGNLRISAGIEHGEDFERVHVRFDDNRVISAATDLEKMFHADASDETHAEGLSLPWAASVISSMNGQLYAEQSQSFEGLVVHLVLPMAKS